MGGGEGRGGGGWGEGGGGESILQYVVMVENLEHCMI